MLLPTIGRVFGWYKHGAEALHQDAVAKYGDSMCSQHRSQGGQLNLEAGLESRSSANGKSTDNDGISEEVSPALSLRRYVISPCLALGLSYGNYTGAVPGICRVSVLQSW